MFAQNARQRLEPRLGGIFARELPSREARAQHFSGFLQVFRFGREAIELAFIFRAAKVDFAQFRKVGRQR